MKYRKISLSLALLGILGLLISSNSYIYESPALFVLSSWIKPFSAMGFITASTYYYATFYQRIRFRKFIFVLFISGISFGGCFLILLALAPFFTNIINIFSGLHSCILFPSLLSGILLTIITLTKRLNFLPATYSHESFATALLPFYFAVFLSMIFNPIKIDDPKPYWLTYDYLSKPAIYHPLEKASTKYPQDILYTGPIQVQYSTQFVNLYTMLKETPQRFLDTPEKVELVDYAEFSSHYLFVLRNKTSNLLLIFDHAGNLVKRIDKIGSIYHSDSTLAAVDSFNKKILLLNSSLEQIHIIPFVRTLKVKKIVFSHHLFAILYNKKERSTLRPATFSDIYRLDTGDRIGNVRAQDIAPKLRRTGFIAVNNTQKGLSIIVLDRNSNKRSYLFNKKYFDTVKIRQCGADRFFIKAQTKDNDTVTETYSLLYDFHKYRKIIEKTSSDKTPDDANDIIAIMKNYFITESNTVVDQNLRAQFDFGQLYGIPYRIIATAKNSFVLRAEGSIQEIDFTPLISGLSRRGRFTSLLTDIKNTLIIKKITKFSDYFLVITRNRIYVYDNDLNITNEIDFFKEGYIKDVRNFKKGIVIFFQKDKDLYIYLLGNDFEERLIAEFDNYTGSIWHVSEDSLVYGYESKISHKIGSFNEPGILIAKNFKSGMVFHKRLPTRLKGTPFLEQNRLFLPYKHLTEVIDIDTGKRRIIKGNIKKIGPQLLGLLDEKYAVDLLTLAILPYNVNSDKVGSAIYSDDNWIDLYGYLINSDEETFYEVIRSGITNFGYNSVCSNTRLGKINLVNCLDLTNKDNLMTFNLNRDYEILYSGPDTVFLKDTHSLVAIKTKRPYTLPHLIHKFDLQ